MIRPAANAPTTRRTRISPSWVSTPTSTKIAPKPIAVCVVNGVASHHNDVPPVGPLGILVSAADAISASRPGARSESMTTYIKRVVDLEKIGSSFPGVEKCFAVQAGRELRVIVQPEHISDEEAFLLARSVSRKIEDELQYPGQIRVTVVRETRCVEFAK